jgi:hypothetical protein
MIYLESIFTEESCNKIIQSIRSCIVKSQPVSGSHDSLLVLDNVLNSELIREFKSPPWIAGIEHAHHIGSVLTGDDVEEANGSSISVGWYENGSNLGPHVDISSRPGSSISFAVILYLNDDYGNGELVIYDKKKSTEHFKNRYIVEPVPAAVVVARIKPAVGSAVIIGSDVFHEVNPITSGEKYIVTLLFHKKQG